MGELTRSIIARLRDRDPSLTPDLWMVSDLLRRVLNRNNVSGIKEIDSEDISHEEGVELKSALLEAFHSETDVARRRDLLVTLAAAHEPCVKDELVCELHLALQEHRSASWRLWRALYSLEDIGEQVFERSETSRGLDRIEQNVKAAERYLQRHDIVVPLGDGLSDV